MTRSNNPRPTMRVVSVPTPSYVPAVLGIPPVPKHITRDDLTKGLVVGTVQCENVGCQQHHPAEFSHFSQYGDEPVFAVVCTQDWLTDYYTPEGITLNEGVDL